MIYGFAVHKKIIEYITLVVFLIITFNSSAQEFTVEIKNTLNFNRKEVVEIDVKQFIDRQNSLRIKKEGITS